MGVFGYGLRASFENFPHRKIYDESFPEYRMGLYRELVLWEGESRGLNHYLVLGAPGLEKKFEDLLMREEEREAFRLQSARALVSKEEYGHWVEKIREYIVAGDIFQANLSYPVEFLFQGDLCDIYGRVRAENPSPYAGVYFAPDFKMFSNSPELLFRVRKGKIITCPIAGTRRRDPEPERDSLLAKELLLSSKERAEHLMLLDLERNDLGRLCDFGSVRVPRFMDREAYRNVFHIVSTVEGVLRKGVHGRDIFRALFPGGTITGAPKIRSMKIIDELERFPRGFYTGSMGWFAPSGDCETSILIRSLQSVGNKAWLNVGAGIVADSHPENEYGETRHKAASWLNSLGLNENLDAEEKGI